MGNINANCVARDDDSTFSQGKGRESTMPASSSCKGNCDNCNKPGHKTPTASNTCVSLVGDHYLRAAQEEAVGAACITRTSGFRAQKQQRGNGGGSGYTPTATTTAATQRQQTRHGGGSNTVRANTAVTANGTSSPTVITCAPATPAIAPSAPITAPPAPVTALPTLVSSQAAPTPYNTIESPPSGIGHLFLADSTTPGPLKFTTTSDCEASSRFVDSNPIGDIESWMKDVVKLDSPVTIVVAGYSTLRGFSTGTLTVRFTDAQRFLHDMLLQAINVPGLGRRRFSGKTSAFKRVNTVISKESYLVVGLFKIPLRKDTKYPTIHYLDLELAPRGNYQTGAAFPTRVIWGYTIPTGSALASRRLRSRVMGALAPLSTSIRPFFATSTAAPGFPALRTTAPAHGARLISGGTMEAASTSIVTTSFVAPTTTPGLATATSTATPTLPITAMAAAESEHLTPAPETSNREHMAPKPRASKRAHHIRRVEHCRDRG